MAAVAAIKHARPPPCGGRYPRDRLRARRVLRGVVRRQVGQHLQYRHHPPGHRDPRAREHGGGAGHRHRRDRHLGRLDLRHRRAHLSVAGGPHRSSLRDVRRGRGRDADRRLQRSARHPHRHPLADHHARNADDLPWPRDRADRRLLLLGPLRRARRLHLCHARRGGPRILQYRRPLADRDPHRPHRSS